VDRAVTGEELLTALSGAYGDAADAIQVGQQRASVSALLARTHGPSARQSSAVTPLAQVYPST
jgi:hypothetical protein